MAMRPGDLAARVDDPAASPTAVHARAALVQLGAETYTLTKR